jgi:uncharacterized OB-fold protein
MSENEAGQSALMTKVVPLVNYLGLDGDQAHLVGQECVSCGAIFLGRRNGCARCAGRDLRERELPSTGKIRSFTIIHRAPFGIQTPYVAVVVDHDGGGTAKAGLVGVDPVPERVEVGAAVKLVTFPVGTDSLGTTAIGFGYELV